MGDGKSAKEGEPGGCGDVTLPVLVDLMDDGQDLLLPLVLDFRLCPVPGNKGGEGDDNHRTPERNYNSPRCEEILMGMMDWSTSVLVTVALELAWNPTSPLLW